MIYSVNFFLVTIHVLPQVFNETLLICSFQSIKPHRRHVRLRSEIHRVQGLPGSVDSLPPAVYEGYV